MSSEPTKILETPDIQIVIPPKKADDVSEPPKRSKASEMITGMETRMDKPLTWGEYIRRIIIPRWVSIPNKGSEARDLLAAERTMLSWFRSGISLLAIGIAVSIRKLNVLLLIHYHS